MSCCCLVTKSCPTLCKPHELYVACQDPLSMGFPRQEYWSELPFPTFRDLFNPGIRPLFPALAGGIFTAEQPVKVKWKRMSLSPVQLFATPWTTESMEFSRPEYCRGSLSLLQEIFPTQGWNSGLPHCRRILYQLSYKGSPNS